jgi:hypothetical protein
MSRKDANELVKDLREHFKQDRSGTTLELRGGHWHVVNPAGKSLAAFGSTPSDSRFRRNTISRLRNRGIVPRDFR